MKSYKEHLISTKSYGEKYDQILQKPVYRTSAIFPVLNSDNLKTKILFMGYWLVKRNISNLGFLISLRDENGELIYRKNSEINTTKAFEILISDLLKEAGLENINFKGSIELEVFSSVDLVFPYPAFVLHFYNDEGSGLVHTTGRIFNDFEDLKSNESTLVKEAGFDILPGDSFSPFFAFVNGHIASDDTHMKLEIIKESGESRSYDLKLGYLAPLQTNFVELKNYIEVDKFLEGKPGTVKISHNLTGFFPRFIAGNFCKEKDALSLTHTYYDNSENKRESDYHSNKNSNELLDSAIFFPLFLNDDWYTLLKLYPIYSPSNHKISLKFFGLHGELLASLDNFLEIKDDQSNYYTMDFKEILKDHNIDFSKVKGVQLFKEWQDKSKIPTRLKYGLNIGKSDSEIDLPTNICFNSQLSNPKILKKSGTFKWMPLVNNGESLVVIQNSSFVKDYNKEANISLSVYSTFSDDTITRDYKIEANGQIRLKIDGELSEFLDGKSGWVTVKSDNPFVSAWYFDFNDSGIMGGDHSF